MVTMELQGAMQHCHRQTHITGQNLGPEINLNTLVSNSQHILEEGEGVLSQSAHIEALGTTVPRAGDPL